VSRSSAALPSHSSSSPLPLRSDWCTSSSVEPVAPVLEIFSEPARSTRLSCAVLIAPSAFCCSTLIMKTECEREEVAFMLVEATARAASPICSTSYTSSSFATYLQCQDTATDHPASSSSSSSSTWCQALSSSSSSSSRSGGGGGGGSSGGGGRTISRSGMGRRRVRTWWWRRPRRCRAPATLGPRGWTSR
jgi:uncharacterized membrane protein YgcG